MSIKNTAVTSSYDDPRKTDIRVDSHWNESRRVYISIGDEKREIYGYDLIQAITNCMNV